MALRTALYAAVTLLAWSPGARAQDATEIRSPTPISMFTLSAFGDAEGDGETPVVLELVALRPDLSPIDDLEVVAKLKLKPKPKTGGIQSVENTGAGHYRVTWIPPRVAAPTTASLFVTGKNEAKEKVAQSWKIELRPPLPRTMTVALSPTELVLGEQGSATVSIAVEDGADLGKAGEHLVQEWSTGELGALVNAGGGRYTLAFSPPDREEPGIALLSFADRRDPLRLYGAGVVALAGRAEIPVRGPKETPVMLVLGGREYGPMTTDNRGKATFEVDLGPGIEDAELVILGGETPEKKPVKLDASPMRRVAVLPLPEHLPGDSRQTVPLRAFVATPQGLPDTQAELTISASVGEVLPTSHMGEGIYQAEWLPPDVSKQTVVDIQAAVGEKPWQQSQRKVALLPVRPESVALALGPGADLAAGGPFDLQVTASGPGGVGLADQRIEVSANGAKTVGAARGGGGAKNKGEPGVYTVPMTTRGGSPVEVFVEASGVAGRNPVDELILVPSQSRLNNDGLSSLRLTLLALDRQGYPVAEQDIALNVAEGDGSLPKAVTTDLHGVAHVFYTAGRTPGIVQIDAITGSAAEQEAASVSLVQLPPDAAPTLELFRSGTAAQQALAAAWSGRVGTARFEPTPAVPAE